MDTELPKSAHHLQICVAPLVGRVCVTTLLVNAAYVAFLAFFFVSGFDFRPVVLLLFVVIAAAIFLLQSIFVAFLVVDWAKTDYYLMPDKIIQFRGVISMREVICDLKHISLMTLHQGWLGRIFNYGRLELRISPEQSSHHELELVGILYPKQCERAIRTYHERQVQQTQVAGGAEQADEESRDHYLKVPRIIA